MATEDAYSAYKTEFGLRLAALRQAKGLSQRELALRLPGSTDGPQVSRWERGESLPVYATRLVIADVLGVTLQYLDHG
jgi:transcriptional regulator with XRE-family HTH domain